MSEQSTINYMLFGGFTYYPKGGIADMILTSAYLSDITSSIIPEKNFEPANPRWVVTLKEKQIDVEWFEIFDVQSRLIVALGQLTSRRTRLDNYQDYTTILHPQVKVADFQTGLFI